MSPPASELKIRFLSTSAHGCNMAKYEDYPSVFIGNQVVYHYKKDETWCITTDECAAIEAATRGAIIYRAEFMWHEVKLMFVMI